MPHETTPTRGPRPSRRDDRRRRTTSGSNRDNGTSNNSDRTADDRLVVALRRDTAHELLDLVRDVEGDADEDLLDEAAVALHAAVPGRLERVPRSMIVLRVRPDERNLLLALIAEQPADDRRAAALGDRLAGLLQRRSD